MFRISVLSSGAYQDFRSVVGHHLSRQFFGEFCLIWNKKKRVMRFIFRLLSFVCDPESSCAVSIWFSFWCKERGKKFFDWVLSSSDCKLSCWKTTLSFQKTLFTTWLSFLRIDVQHFLGVRLQHYESEKVFFFHSQMYLKTSI